MKTGLKFTAAWLGATIVAVVVAAAAVASVRSHVTDEPTQLGSPEAVALAADVPSASSEPTTTTTLADAITVTTTTAVVETSTTTTMVEATTTTSAQTSDSAPQSTSTTTTTQQPTTTTQPSESYSKTFDTDGGSVRVIVDGDSVTFAGAVPNTGWKVELKEPGPEEVKVEFDQNDGDGEVEFSAKVEGGELRVEISSGDHDD